MTHGTVDRFLISLPLMMMLNTNALCVGLFTVTALKTPLYPKKSMHKGKMSCARTARYWKDD